MEKSRLVLAQRKVVNIFQQLAKSVFCPVQTTDTENIQPVLCQCTGFVEAANINLSRNVDTTGRDAINPELPQSTNREASSYRECSWQRWGYDNCDQIQCSDKDCLPWKL